MTLIGTLGCVLAALVVDSFNFAALTDSARLRSITVDVMLPICLAVPILGFLMTKLRELAIAKHDLTILASTDSLTAVLNHGAFRLIVDGYLDRVDAAQLGGALLVVDVDHFKKINDSFGHDRGDVALKIIAKSIKDAVRDVDLVGRIGGEEFGVFLPGSGVADAARAAERIRDAVAIAEFRPAGSAQSLSVSVGGATFATRIAFVELFHAADQRLSSGQATRQEPGRNGNPQGRLA